MRSSTPRHAGFDSEYSTHVSAWRHSRQRSSPSWRTGPSTMCVLLTGLTEEAEPRQVASKNTSHLLAGVLGFLLDVVADLINPLHITDLSPRGGDMLLFVQIVSPSAKCEDWARCKTLSGYCCPHEDGSMLACCGAKPEHPHHPESNHQHQRQRQHCSRPLASSHISSQVETGITTNDVTAT